MEMENPSKRKCSCTVHEVAAGRHPQLSEELTLTVNTRNVSSSVKLHMQRNKWIHDDKTARKDRPTFVCLACVAIAKKE